MCKFGDKICVSVVIFLSEFLFVCVLVCLFVYVCVFVCLFVSLFVYYSDVLENYEAKKAKLMVVVVGQLKWTSLSEEILRL